MARYFLHSQGAGAAVLLAKGSGEHSGVAHILVPGFINPTVLTEGSVLWRCCHVIGDADITSAPPTEGNMWVWSGLREHKLCTNIVLFLQVNQVFNKRPWKCQQSEQINQNSNWVFIQTKKYNPFFINVLHTERKWIRIQIRKIYLLEILPINRYLPTLLNIHYTLLLKRWSHFRTAVLIF